MKVHLCLSHALHAARMLCNPTFAVLAPDGETCLDIGRQRPLMPRALASSMTPKFSCMLAVLTPVQGWMMSSPLRSFRDAKKQDLGPPDRNRDGGPAHDRATPVSSLSGVTVAS